MADQLLSRTYSAIGFTAFLCFLSDIRCCENLCGSKTGNLEQLWISL